MTRRPLSCISAALVLTLIPIASSTRHQATQPEPAPPPTASSSPSHSLPAKTAPKPKRVQKPKVSVEPRPKATRTATAREPGSATTTRRPSYASPKAYARTVLSAAQFLCADAVFTRESAWNPFATNPTSGAYGIAQALPAEKYASAGPDWRVNGITQVRWGLSYMKSRYGTPCGAWAFWQSHHWY